MVSVECDKAQRDGKTHKEQLEKIQRLQDNERAAFESSTKELSDRLNAAVISKEEEVGRRHEIQELNKDYRTNIDKLRSQVIPFQLLVSFGLVDTDTVIVCIVHSNEQLDASKAQITQLEGVKEAEISVLKATVRDLQRDLSEKSRQAARAQKEADDGKENYQQQLSALERKMAEEANLLRFVLCWLCYVLLLS